MARSLVERLSELMGFYKERPSVKSPAIPSMCEISSDECNEISDAFKDAVDRIVRLQKEITELENKQVVEHARHLGIQDDIRRTGKRYRDAVAVLREIHDSDMLDASYDAKQADLKSKIDSVLDRAPCPCCGHVKIKT